MRTLVIAGGLTLFFLVIFLVSCVTFQNTAVNLESSVKGQYQKNQNTYDAFWKTVKESAQISDEYKEAFKEILVDDTQARYGKDGAGAAFLMLNERPINFDDKTYLKIMQLIESGRHDFRQGQDDLLDKQRVYENHLRSVSGSFFAGITGFPKEVGGELAPPFDKDGDGRMTVLDYKIVTSAKTEAAFATAKDDEIDVFNKRKP